jgi:hypothetical protein
MPQYMVAVYLPDDYDPSVETEATIEAIHAVNRELIAAGVRRFACESGTAAGQDDVRAGERAPAACLRLATLVRTDAAACRQTDAIPGPIPV